jgi:hypothetical protein
VRLQDRIAASATTLPVTAPPRRFLFPFSQKPKLKKGSRPLRGLPIRIRFQDHLALEALPRFRIILGLENAERPTARAMSMSLASLAGLSVFCGPPTQSIVAVADAASQQAGPGGAPEQVAGLTRLEALLEVEDASPDGVVWITVPGNRVTRNPQTGPRPFVYCRRDFPNIFPDLSELDCV